MHVYLYANVTELQTNENASEVHVVKIRTLQGLSGSVRAQHVVLACNAIENARLMLLSNKQQHEGLGNGHDNVGRFFMQHPHLKGAVRGLVSERGKQDPILLGFRKDETNLVGGSP